MSKCSVISERNGKGNEFPNVLLEAFLNRTRRETERKSAKDLENSNGEIHRFEWDKMNRFERYKRELTTMKQWGRFILWIGVSCST